MHELVTDKRPRNCQKKRKKEKKTQSEGIQFARRTLVAQNMQMLRSVGAGYAGNNRHSLRLSTYTQRVWRERFPANRLATCHSLHD